MTTKGRGNTLHIPPGYFTTKTLAKKVGVHEDTVTRWRKAGLLASSGMDAGRITVHLFDADALRVAQSLASGNGYRLTDRVA